MAYEIILSPEAEGDFKKLKAHMRAVVRDAIQKHLRYEPIKQSKSRIKRLRGIRRPHYRLRIDEIRIYYDVYDAQVEVLAIIEKSRAALWLRNFGETE